MPSYRLLHPNCRTGNRIKKLTDLEYLVWLAYLLSADDFGVCPASATKLMGDDPRLEHKPRRHIERAIEVLLTVALVRAFEDEGTRYLYQTDWREWQSFQYPSTKTSYPPIPAIDLVACSMDTIELFLEHHPKVVGRNYIDPDLLPTRSRSRSKSLDPKIKTRFDEFWLAYPRKVGKAAAWRKWQSLAPDDALTRDIIQAVQQQAQTPQWQKDEGQFIPHPSTYLNQERWTDEAVVAIAELDLSRFRPKGS